MGVVGECDTHEACFGIAPCTCHALQVPHLHFTFPTMAATSGGAWVCAECGKVCRSRGGLTQHSSTHKRYPRMRKLHDTSYRVYHPSLDGMFSLSLCLASSDPLQGSHVIQMENSSLLERHQLPPH